MSASQTQQRNFRFFPFRTYPSVSGSDPHPVTETAYPMTGLASSLFATTLFLFFDTDESLPLMRLLANMAGAVAVVDLSLLVEEVTFHNT